VDGSDEIETDKEKIVASSTGYDIETVRKSLNEFNGDVDATIEYLLAIRQAEMRSAEAAEAAENKKEDVKNGKEETTNVISSSPPSSENATSLTMEPPEKTVSNEKEKKSNISFEGMNIEDLKQLLQGFNRQSEILQATIKDTGHRSDVETYKATYVAISKDIEELKQELAKQEKTKMEYEDTILAYSFMVEEEEKSKGISKGIESKIQQKSNSVSEKDDQGWTVQHKKKSGRNEEENELNSADRTQNNIQYQSFQHSSKRNNKMSNKERKRFAKQEKMQEKTKKKEKEQQIIEEINSNDIPDLGTLRI